MNVEARCPDCGTPAHLKHLRNCKTFGSSVFKAGTNNAATRSQLDMVTNLIKQLDYDEENYNLETISSVECSKLITQLMIEIG